MKRLLKPFRATPQTKPAATNRRPTFRPQLEELDQRLVPSLSSAISIQHHTGFADWTERDWYSTEPMAFSPERDNLVQYQGTSRYNRGALDSMGGKILAVSASIDPNTGFGEAFVLEYAIYYVRGDFSEWAAGNGLALCDSSGYYRLLAPLFKYPAFAEISATRDGHVYAATADGNTVWYIDSTGNGIDLGAPVSGLLIHPQGAISQGELAVSVGMTGGNELFIIGRDRALYVNSSNTKGDWRLVDNKAQFASLSATANNTVFALTVGLPEIGRGGLIYQETEQYSFKTYRYYWASQYISGGSSYTSISADTDALGRDEVYAVDVGRNAWLYNAYNSAKWTIKDSDVFDLAAAGGGYFYDVNYYYSSGLFLAYQWNPDAGSWIYLDSGLI
jgi:hypothetical protein